MSTAEKHWLMMELEKPAHRLGGYAEATAFYT